MKRTAMLLLGLVYWSNSLAAEIFIGVEEEPDVCAVKKHLAYGPAIVELTGNVVEKKYYGPPNYGETPKEDRVEGALILMLDEPFSISASPADLTDQEHACVDRVQLVIHKNVRYPKVGEHVTLSGTLFGNVTGHHRTKVLLDVPTPSTTIGK